MLYVIFADPQQVRFTEYIAHFLVRATSPGKAREFVKRAYPKHPVDLDATFVRIAPVQGLIRLEPRPGVVARSPLYFAHEGLSDQTLRLLASGLGASEDQEIWLDPALSHFVPMSVAGRAGVLARCENRTPAIAQSDLERPVFCWKAVSDRWPNPNVDPIAAETPPSAQMQLTELAPQALEHLGGQ